MENNILPKRNLPRDLFLHLLAIVTLYWSATTFVTLLWQTINYFLPDVLNYYPSGILELLRFAIASLIIVFPVFLLTSWYLNKVYRREAVVRESKIRKWLLYLTLFIAAIIVIIDLVTVVLTLLAGDTTSKFILKALSVLLVAVAVFWYYFDDVKKDSPTKLAKPFAWVTTAIVFAGIVNAFFIVGSPATARMTQYDQQKVEGLQVIQLQIVNYWQRKEVLPGSLSVLKDTISGFDVPSDPQTGEQYEYNIKDAPNLTFELCATFNTKLPPAGTVTMRAPTYPGDIMSQSWDHGAGRVCFERAIDKQLYPPLEK